MDNLRRILLTFAGIVFVVLAVVGIVLTVQLNTQPKEDRVVLKPSDQKYNKGDVVETPEPTSDTATLMKSLIVVKGELSENLYFVSSTDTVSGSMTLLFVHADTKFSYKQSNSNADVYKLQEFHEQFGIQKALEVLSGVLNIRLDSFVVMDNDEFSRFVDCFTSRDDGVLFSLPLELSIKKDDTLNVLSKGEQYFNGFKTGLLLDFSKTENEIYSADLLKFYDGTQTGKVRMSACFIKEFVKQKLTGNILDYYRENYAQFLDMFIEQYSQTNVSKTETKRIAENLLNVKDVKAYVYNVNDNDIYQISMGAEDFQISQLDDKSSSELLSSMY